MGVSPYIEDRIIFDGLTPNGYEQSISNLPVYSIPVETVNEISVPAKSEQTFDATAPSLYSNLSLENKFFVCFDSLLVGSCFREYDEVMDKGLSYNFCTQKDYVEVEVRATIVAPDSDSNKGIAGDCDVWINRSLDASNFVGDIKTSSNANFKEGTSVTSLIKCPVQSRFVSMPPQLLIPIPPMLDAGEAVTLVSTYLPAFGALHHGSPKRERRFSKKVLRRSNILITGGGTNEADAVVKLALLGGAAKVFVLVSEKTKTTYHVGSHQVLALNEDPAVWLPRLQGEIDVVIDVAYPKNFEALKSAVTPTGRYVAVVPAQKNNNIFSSLVRTALCASNGILMYDFDEICENCYEDLLEDLQFLFRRLVKRKLRPAVDKYIKMRDVAIVEEDMRRHPVIGAIVCEPWRS